MAKADNRPEPLVSPSFVFGSSERFLAALYNGLTEGVFVIHQETLGIVYWNKGAEAMFGYSAADARGKSCGFIYPDKTAFERTLATAGPTVRKQGCWRGESEFCRRDSLRFTGEVTATVLDRDEIDQPYVVIVVRDITKQKLAEQNIRSLNEELEHRVRERTIQLENVVDTLKKESAERKRAEEQLRDRDRLSALGATAARLAHEIGNPLNGMHATIQFLERYLRKSEGNPDETLISTVEDLKNEIDRLRALLDELREFSRPLVLDLQPTDLAELVTEVLNLEESECEQQGIVVEREFNPELPLALVDSLKIKQVLLNLCKNAVEAMPKGGRLTFKAYPSHTGVVVLEIQDTGEGIPPGTPIFDLHITSKPHGTGLGLVIVQQIVSAHSGSIRYASRPGEGTTFYLTLPGAAKAAREAVASIEPAPR